MARRPDRVEPLVAAALRQLGPSERLASVEGAQGLEAEVAPAAQPQGWVVERVAWVATVATVERPAAQVERPAAAAAREPLAEGAQGARPVAVASRGLPAGAASADLQRPAAPELGGR